MQAKQKPVVLVFSGFDPCGGAGIQADIETIASLGAFAAPVITSLTAQNTQTCAGHQPQHTDDFMTQTQLIFEDLSIKACKIGLTADLKLIKAIRILLEGRDFPVVFDPVLDATTGYRFTDNDLRRAMLTKLLPLATVITPNYREALQLTDAAGTDEASRDLLDRGCRYVLMTDVTDSETEIVNQLYTHDGDCRTYQWQRLPGNFHGSGCTLAAAISALLAKDMDVSSAVEQAQQFTWHCLKHGLQLGRGQQHPNRFFWQDQVLKADEITS